MEEIYVEKLARWWNTLNSWEWPDDLSGKPNGFDSFPAIVKDNEFFIPNKHDWISSIMRGIEKKIGNKEVLRWHHIHNLDSSNEEFEEWWKLQS